MLSRKSFVIYLSGSIFSISFSSRCICVSSVKRLSTLISLIPVRRKLRSFIFSGFGIFTSGPSSLILFKPKLTLEFMPRIVIPESPSEKLAREVISLASRSNPLSFTNGVRYWKSLFVNPVAIRNNCSIFIKFFKCEKSSIRLSVRSKRVRDVKPASGLMSVMLFRHRFKLVSPVACSKPARFSISALEAVRVWKRLSAKASAVMGAPSAIIFLSSNSARTFAAKFESGKSTSCAKALRCVPPKIQTQAITL